MKKDLSLFNLIIKHNNPIELITKDQYGLSATGKDVNEAVDNMEEALKISPFHFRANHPSIKNVVQCRLIINGIEQENVVLVQMIAMGW